MFEPKLYVLLFPSKAIQSLSGKPSEYFLVLCHNLLVPSRPDRFPYSGKHGNIG